MTERKPIHRRTNSLWGDLALELHPAAATVNRCQESDGGSEEETAQELRSRQGRKSSDHAERSSGRKNS